MHASDPIKISGSDRAGAPVNAACMPPLEMGLATALGCSSLIGCGSGTMSMGTADPSVETFGTTASHAETAADFAIR